MLLGGLQEGSWYIISKKDPRWNASGTGFVGMLTKPEEVDATIEEKKKTLGEPPDDLEWGYMKN